MSYKYDVYLAGPFFNPEQVARMDYVKMMLKMHDLKVCDPRELGPVIVNTSEQEKTPEFFAKIFSGNIEGMNESFMIFASVDDKDIGTAFELGYFYKAGKFVATFAFTNAKTNVMLSQAVDIHFRKMSDLDMFLEQYSEKIKKHLFSLRIDMLFSEKPETNE